MPDRILPLTARRVLEKLHFSAPPRASWAGLESLYRAWCRQVPFDNVRKRIALRTGDPSPLPGGHAEDFFEAWLEHGTGGTCWPAANALHALLKACGFEARRVAGSMLEKAELNHASVVVHLDERDYLVDASLLTEAPIPLPQSEKFENDDPVHAIRLEPIADGWRIEWAVPVSRETIPCRLDARSVDHDLFREQYELSRLSSRFNDALYARRNREGAVVSLVGAERFEKNADRVRRSALTQSSAAAALERDIGLSLAIIDRLRRCGGLGES